MKKLIPILMFLLATPAIAAPVCKLKTPVPIRLDEDHRQTFSRVSIDQVPRHIQNKSIYTNGLMKVLISETGNCKEFWSRDCILTGVLGASVESHYKEPNRGFSFGLAERYIGLVSTYGDVQRSGNTEVHNAYDNVHVRVGAPPTKSRVTIVDGKITAVELWVPFISRDQNGAEISNGEETNVCVTEMSTN